eukprot:GHVN01049203.1.p3 GENE.GHVN01049203.1~~GHVN01049203.1.p3  ORF type:complete len:245 (+),score=45.31 GHVN01049203.1:1722-2456(+)
MMYDRALTVFSPDGHLFQVDYAIKAVEKGAAVVGMRGKNFILLGVEKKELQFLQKREMIRKIANIGENMWMGFSGLSADARVLVDMARKEVAKHRLSYDEPMNVEQAARQVAGIQQSYTIQGGVRPFGVGVVISGFDDSGKPRLFFSEPSGVCVEWKANAIGQGSKEIRKLLERGYNEEISFDDALQMVVSSLLEAAQASRKNIEVFVIRENGFESVPEEKIGDIISSLEALKEKELRDAMDLD